MADPTCERCGVDTDAVSKICEGCEHALIIRAERAEAANEKLREALEFYADPETYHAITFMIDPPCGGFEDDFDEDHGDEFYDRPMPGKRARAALYEE